jgi:hypothetical protein
MTTLGRELKRRGHRVTLIARPDARVKTESVGLEFIAVGERDFPAGSMAGTTAQLGRLGGLSAIRFTAELLGRAACGRLIGGVRRRGWRCEQGEWFKLRGERSASSAIIALISLVPLLTVFWVMVRYFSWLFIAPNCLP